MCLRIFRLILLFKYFIFAVSEASGGHDPSFRKGVRRGVKARFQNVFDVGGFYVECDSEKQFHNSDEIISSSLCLSSTTATENQQEEEVRSRWQEVESPQLSSNFLNELQHGESRDDDEKGREDEEIEEKVKSKAVRSRTATRTSRRAAGTVESQRGIGIV